MITKVSWKHGATITFPVALQLRSFRIDINGPLGDATLGEQQQVVQVWFVANNANINNAPVVPSVQHIHVTSKIEATGITVGVTEPAANVRQMIGSGGMMLIRVHCGFLFDKKDRPVSAALNAITSIPNKAPVYGGIFESWFFVAAG
jgi:hypothetical protein